MDFYTFPTIVWADKTPAQTAIVWHNLEYKKELYSFLDLTKNTISWQELDNILVKFIQHLTASNVQAKQLVAYSGKDDLVNLLCYCAVLKMGARILMLNPALTDPQRKQILQNNKVDFFITDHHFLDFKQIHQNNNSQSLVFKPNQPATLTLTSGSSGNPKAVVHSIENHLASAQGVCEFMHFTEKNSWLLSLPLFHVSGQGIVWRWLKKGAILHIVQNKETFWKMLSNVSHASLVPTQLQTYLDWLNKENRTKVNQKILLGGANIPALLITQAKQKGITTFAGYGLTEMASTVTAIENQTDNVGKPLLNRQVKIVENEIWVKGKPLALGYWQNQKIIPLTNPQGWFQTKDYGDWKENNLVIKGRLDNMFISGGENIQPEEIEKVLFSSHTIKTIFVVPVKDQKFGERPVAVVEFTQPFNLQAVQFLQEFAKNNLEKFKQPIAYLPFKNEQFQQGGIKVSRAQLKCYAEQQIV